MSDDQYRERDNLYRAYLENQAEYLSRVENIPYERAERIVKEIMQKTIKEPVFELMKTERPGVIVPKTMTFRQLRHDLNKSIVAPNGRIYYRPTDKPAVNRDFILNLKANRDYHKALKFKYQQLGDEVRSRIEDFIQSRAKMFANSIAGGAKNTPGNPFTDKPGFNATTATTRAVIRIAIANCEQFLGGLVQLQDQEAMIGYISHLLLDLKSKYVPLRAAMDRHGIKYTSKEELVSYFGYLGLINKLGPLYQKRSVFKIIEERYLQKGKGVFGDTMVGRYIHQHGLAKDDRELFPLERVKELIATMDAVERSYVFYHLNFLNLFWENEVVFRRWVDSMHQYEGTEPNLKIFKQDKNLITMTMTRFKEEVKGKELDKIGEEEPELFNKLCQFGTHVKARIDDMQDLFGVLLVPTTNPQRLNIKHNMWRKTTAGSDTDSVMFTRKIWRLKYSGQVFINTPETTMFEELIVYFYSQVVDHSIALFTLQLGAPKSDVGLLNMKNEMSFDSMTFFRIKKHYGGPVSVQEGRVLPKPKLDIKGLQLRGSHLPPDIRVLLERLLTDTTDKISARILIAELIHFERAIYKGLRMSETSFLMRQSIQGEDHYEDEEDSDYRQYLWWNEIFGPTHGELRPPGKFLKVYLNKITPEVVQQVTDYNPAIGKRLLNKYTEMKRSKNSQPNGMVINPVVGKIPSEVSYLMDFRKHVFTMMKPIYLTLASFNIPIMFPKNFSLLSDYYTKYQIEGLLNDRETYHDGSVWEKTGSN